MENLKHRFDDRDFVIAGVDPAEYESLVHDFYTRFAPQSTVECFHVDLLIYNVWTSCRLLRFQKEFRHDAAKPDLKAALDKAARVLQGLERRYLCIINNLQVVQQERMAQPANTPECGELASFSHQAPSPRPRRCPPKRTAADEWIQ